MVTEKIKGRLVALRVADEDDADFTLSIRQDNSNTLFMPKLNSSVEQQKKWLREQLESEDCYFFVIERGNGECIGTFSLYNINAHRAESGRLIVRGLPIETIEASILFNDFSYEEVGIETIYFEIEINNNAALGLARRFGARETERIINNKSGVEMIKMEMTKQDYLGRREKLINLLNRFVERSQ